MAGKRGNFRIQAEIKRQVGKTEGEREGEGHPYVVEQNMDDVHTFLTPSPSLFLSLRRQLCSDNHHIRPDTAPSLQEKHDCNPNIADERSV